MAALVVVNVDIKDPVLYEEYKKLAHRTVLAHGGRYVVRGGKVDVLEGSWRPARFVVLEFPSVERAKAWWDSDDYRAARDLRNRIAVTDMIVVEGV
jgi:uncharacterized protein (DUF1330 family)